MITIVLTNRNREQHIIEKCLISLNNQTNKGFQCIIVDYGSRPDKVKDLEKITSQHIHYKVINCKTSKQLWNKSRAINIVLKQCSTPYFFVGDIDMIYHPEFVERLYSLKKEEQSVYFQVGFLGESESKKNKTFFDFDFSFKSTKEATGMTLYKTEELRSINGYDEFYNGWGSEDTDTHVRLLNANHNIVFYDKELLILHQWHPKSYRQKNSTAPFHSNMEKINQKYLEYTRQSGKVLANTKYNWGQYNEEDYKFLNYPEVEFTTTNELADFKGLLNNVLLSLDGKVVSISIKRHSDYKSVHYFAKKLLGKKVKIFMGMQHVNDILLESIIVHCRNSAYKYIFDRNSQEITLVIKL